MDKKEYDKSYSRKYRKENPEWKQRSNAEYRSKHHYKYKERYCFKNRSEYMKKYNKEHREELNEYAKKWHREKRKSNLQYRLSRNLANAVYLSLKEQKAGRKWEELVGYTLKDLMKHLEKQFKTWMSWNNYGKWQIDHIKPKSLFKYVCPEDKEFKECWALGNLRPLEKIANIRKSNRYSRSSLLL